MQTKTTEHRELDSQTQKNCMEEVRKAKRRFESKISVSGNKRPFINSYIKSITKPRVTARTLKINDETVTYSIKIA